MQKNSCILVIKWAEPLIAIELVCESYRFKATQVISSCAGVSVENLIVENLFFWLSYIT